MKSAAKLTGECVLLLAIVYAVLGLRPSQVSGISMTPRIASGDYVVINVLSYRFGKPSRGDVVAFKHERSAPAVYLKRLIGMPGDTVAIDRGVVSVDGAVLDEPYVRFRDARSLAKTVVPNDAYFVLGDDRPNSDDSRAWGFVPASDLIGRAILEVWPLAHARVIR